MTTRKSSWDRQYNLLCGVFNQGPQFSSVAQSCLTLHNPSTAACQASLSITSFWSLLKLMSIESVMPSNHLILCHPLLLPPSIFPNIRVSYSESVLRIRWPEYWSFSFNISPSNEYSGLIPFRMDWLDLLAVQGTLKSLLQRYSSKTSIVLCSAFFRVQLSHPYQRRKWHPTSVFLPAESQRWQSLVDCCLWGRTESDTTDAT